MVCSRRASIRIASLFLKNGDENLRFLVNLMVSMVKEGLAHLVLGLKGEGQV